MDQEQGVAARIARGALAGLIAGVAASFAMDRFQALVSAMSEQDDAGEPTTVKAGDAVAKAFTGKSVSEADKPLAGQAAHYALGTALGVAYGIAAAFRPGVTAGYGTLFGIGSAALIDEAAVPASGLTPPPWQTPATTHLFGLASHLVFGGVAEAVRRQVDATLAPAT